MSDVRVPVQSDSDSTKGRVAFVIGGISQNRIAKDLHSRGVVELEPPTDSPDAFIVRYCKADDREFLVFAGNTALGTLYAVYHYLENYCDVGTFLDGEHVPERKSIPAEGVNIAESPRIRDRHFGFSMGYGIKKYFNQFRTADEMNQAMDWMAKRRLNRTGWGFFAYPGGTESRTVFGYECKPEEDYGAGWPRGWTFAPEYRTKMLQDWFAFARKRGIQIYYSLEFGLVPVTYRQQHPELPYLTNLGYDANTIRPDSPECLAVMKQYIDEIVRLYGTDHIYQCTPFCESAGAATPDEALDVKMKAAKALCATLGKLDPQYVWQSDSWDFGAVPSVWTSERLSKYFTELEPLRDRMYIYDTTSEANPFWKRTECFGGTPWAFGVLHSFQGDDHLHGDLARVLASFKEATEDPRSTNLKGMYTIPESFGHNVLYYQFISEMAWDPARVNVESFLNKYCRTRYSAASQESMLDCTHKIVDAVSSGGGIDMYYQRMGIVYNPVVAAPFDDFQSYNASFAELCREIGLMEDAIVLALSMKSTESGNTLYENDLVDYVKTMLGLKSNYFIIKAYEAFKVGNLQDFNQNTARALKCLDGIEIILSTRPDFSLQKTIDEAMAIPGTNPFVPRMIRKHAINDLYAPVENYEQLVLFYKPRVAAYFDEMRKRLERGERAFSRADMNSAFAAFDQQWWDNDCRVPADKRFAGSTIDAILSVYMCVPFGEIRGGGNIELKADQVLTSSPGVSGPLQPIEWEDGHIVVDEVGGRKVWRIKPLLYMQVKSTIAMNCEQPVVIAVDYLDKGTGQLDLHYDSPESPYKSVPLATLTDSGEWKTVRLTLKDARLGKHENGSADFRLAATPESVAVARILVASPTVTALPTFEQVKGRKQAN